MGEPHSRKDTQDTLAHEDASNVDATPRGDSQREHRLEALRELAGAAGQPTSTGAASQGALSQQLRPRAVSHSAHRWRLRGALIVGVVIVVVAGLGLHALTSRPSANQPAAGPVVITPLAQGMACAVDLAWSTDSQRVAVLGYTRGCPNPPGTSGASGTPSGLVIIYDAAKGLPRAQFSMDKSIESALNAQTATSGTSTSSLLFEYETATWLPGDQTLAIYFVASNPNITSAYASGLVLINIKTQAERVLATPLLANEQSDLEWDLATGKVIASHLDTGPLAATARFAWGQNGALTATLPIAPALAGAPLPTPVAGPVGTSDGGANFTLWQPGQAGLAETRGRDLEVIPGMYTWNTYNPAVSPDGRYFVESVNSSVRVQLPNQTTPSAQTLAEAALTTTPVVAARDAALARVYTHLSALSSDAYVSWRPNGAQLAAISSDTDSTSQPITVYNSANGTVVTTLTPQTDYPGIDGGGYGSPLQWSPDGTHLAFLAPELGTITIWGPGQLSQ